MNDLETVLEAVSVAITDDRQFQSAVGRIHIDFELPQADGRGSAIANPDWAVAYKNGSLSKKEYIGKVRKNTRRDRDDTDL
ncbi:hypothetical protein [Halovivax limisalsi]|uniref:hypothetical protein n=1 Tax=Halovivax limisalsi TaxID=1453760 RepID=UPI001FFD1759|nr:hypothetical protein [Halovivax limisalsi]